jgi:hypothetical protein
MSGRRVDVVARQVPDHGSPRAIQEVGTMGLMLPGSLLLRADRVIE